MYLFLQFTESNVSSRKTATENSAREKSQGKFLIY